MPNLLRDLRVDAVSLVDRAAVRDPQNKSEPRRFLFWKREGATPDTNTPQGGENMPDETAAVLKAENDELRAELEKLSAKAPSAGATNSGAATPTGRGDVEDEDRTDQEGTPAAPSKRASRDSSTEESEVEKSDESTMLLKAEMVSLRKQAEAAEKMAKAEHDLRVEREYVQKAADEFQNLGLDAEDLGLILKRANENLSPEDYTSLETVLKAAASQSGTNQALLRELGRTGQPKDGTQDAYSEVKKAAAEIRKSDPSLSEQRALELAARENPDLEARMMREGGPTFDASYGRRF